MYIIDGHNLIGKMPGLSLEDADDELRLIEYLQQFARLRRKAVEVYFDRAPVGRSGTRSYGRIKAHFVPDHSTADQAIARRLTEMGRQARNVILVTSDRQVQANGRSAQARVQQSEVFAEELVSILQTAQKNPAQSPGVDVAQWLAEFKIDPEQADKPIEPVRESKPKKQAPARRKHHGFPPKHGQ